MLLLASPAIAQLSKSERKNAIADFKSSREALHNAVKGLSQAQLNWKPADTVWSVANNVEHLAITEKGIFEWAMSTLKTPADPSKRNQVKNTDDQIKAMISSREKKVKTREEFKPTGQFGDEAGAMKTFNERRDSSIDYVKSTKDDLRNHYTESPLGLLDAYQLMLFISAHTVRHTAQINEIKAMPDFPKQ